MKPQGHIPTDASPSAHEAADLNVRLIVRVTVIMGVILIVLVLAGLFLFQGYEMEFPARTSEAAPTVTEADLPPTPRLQINPVVDLQTVRAKEDQHLTRYAWIDQPKGIAQIPIERAMALWVEKYAATTAPSQVGLTELQMRQQKAQEASHAP